MHKVDILYFIEHVPREFDVACLVKYFLEKQYSLNVKIVSLPLAADETMANYESRCIILPYMYNLKTPVLAKIAYRYKKSIFINLNFEQLFSKANQKFKAPQGDEIKNKVFQYAWSEKFKNFLIENHVKKENIYVGGNPSLALYLEPYRNYFQSRSQLAEIYNLDPKKKWVFFPENYAWAFFGLGQLISRVRQGFKPSLAVRNKIFNLRSLRQVLKWLKKLSELEGFEVIIRPRPAISADEYQAVMKKTLKEIPQNMHLIKDGSVREWNLASDVVVSSYSTSLIEAAMANKPAYIMEPYKFHSSMEADFIDLLDHLKSIEELERICRKLDPHSSDKARDYIKNGDLPNGDAIVNLVNFIYESFKSSGDSKRYLKVQLERATRDLGKLSWVGKYLSKAQTKEERLRFSHDLFNEEKINQNLERWAKVLEKNARKV